MEAEKKYAETYGGKVGGILPLLGMIAAIVVLCFTGMSSLRNFWGAGFMAMVIGLLVFKDKNRYAKAVMKGFANPSFTMLFPIFNCGRYPVTDPNGRPPGGWPGLSCESGQYPTCHYPLRDLRTVCGNVHCDGQLGGRPLGHDAHAVPNGCADGLSRRP